MMELIETVKAVRFKTGMPLDKLTDIGINYHDHKITYSDSFEGDNDVSEITVETHVSGFVYVNHGDWIIIDRLGHVDVITNDKKKNFFKKVLK